MARLVPIMVIKEPTDPLDGLNEVMVGPPGGMITLFISPDIPIDEKFSDVSRLESEVLDPLGSVV